MPDPLAGTQFTDMWLQNPWGMTQADQLSNQFSNFNNKPFPFPPVYNADAAAGGGPTDAMGRPIGSFQAWQAANPGGTTINNTPAQAPQQGNTPFPQGIYSPNYMSSLSPATQQALQGQGQRVPLSQMLGGNNYGNQNQNDAAGIALLMGMDPSRLNGFGGGQQPRQQTPQQAAPQQNAPPNNWQAAINALANPGNPTTPGATVAPVTGFQPAGGVNNAFLQQAQGRPGMNQNFMSALAAIQGRKQA